jgi:succinate dehydrogenase / fumarate reductase cytochrome b subunit
MAFKYAYYPGCASQAITKEADSATRKVAERLDISLFDMPKANCCGAGLLRDYNHMLNLTLNARIFAEAETMRMDILTICSTCLMVMNTANRDMKKDGKILEEVNGALKEAGLRYSGKTRIRQLLWALVEDYGLENLKKRVIRPLKGLKVAPFYGCHSLRPSSALGFDNPQNPRSLAMVLETLGAEVMDYPGKTECCGFQLDLVNVATATSMTAVRLIEAKENGAACLCTPCPFCHINLDNYQGMAEKRAERKIRLPVFHLSQLVGLSLGMDEKELGLARHLVSPEKTLKGLL